jgi:hypothetical protein
MISATKIFSISLVMFLLAWLGMGLHILEAPIGRYIIYFSVSIGGLTIAVGGIALMLGRLKDDLKRSERK